MTVDIEETVTEDFGFRSITTGIKVAPALDPIPLKELNLLAWGNITKKFALAIGNTLLIGDTFELDSYINLSTTEEEEKQTPVFEGGHRTEISGVSQLVFNVTETSLLASINNDLKKIEPSSSEITNIESFDAPIRDIYASPFYSSICAVLLEDRLVILDIDNISNRLELRSVSSFAWSKADKSTFFTITDKTIQRKTFNGTESEISQPDSIEDSFRPLQITSILKSDEELLFAVYGESIDQNEHDYQHYIIGGSGEQKILDVCPPYGSLPRLAIYYLNQLNSWSPNWPDVVVVASSPSTDIQAFTPEKLVNQLNDTDRAQLPLDEDSGEDDTPLGLAIDLTSTQEVLEPCNGIDTSKPLPRVWVLTNQGKLLSWALFDAHGIKSDSLSNEVALQTYRSYYETAKELPAVSLTERNTAEKQILFEEQQDSKPDVNLSSSTQPEDKKSLPTSGQHFSLSEKKEATPFSSSGFTSKPSESSGFNSHGFSSSGFGSSGFGASPFKSSNFSYTQENTFSKENRAFGSFKNGSTASEPFARNAPAFGSTGFGSNSSSSSPFAKLSQQGNKALDSGSSSTSSPFSKFATSNNSQSSPFASIASNKNNNESIFGGEKSKGSIFDTSSKPTNIFQKEDSKVTKKSIFELAATNVGQLKNADTEPKPESDPDNELGNKLYHLIRPKVPGDSNSSSSPPTNQESKPDSDINSNKPSTTVDSNSPLAFLFNKKNKGDVKPEDLFGNTASTDNPFSSLNIGTKEGKSATEPETLNEAFSHKISINPDPQKFTLENNSSKETQSMDEQNIQEEYDIPHGESDSDKSSESAEQSVSVSSSDQELAHASGDKPPLISSREGSSFSTDQKKVPEENSSPDNPSGTKNEQFEYTATAKETEAAGSSTGEHTISNDSNATFATENHIDEPAQGGSVNFDSETRKSQISTTAVVPFNEDTTPEKSENSEGDSSSFEMVKVEDAKEDTDEHNRQRDSFRNESTQMDLQSKGTETANIPMKDVAVGDDHSTLHASSTQTDDELTLSEKNPPMNVPEYVTLGKIIMPQLDSDPIMNEIEKVYHEVESEFAILKTNSDNIGKYIEDHQNLELTHTELSLEYESYWRLGEAETIKGYVEDFSEQLKKDLDELKSVEQETLDQLSTLKSQFSDTNEVKNRIYSLEQFKNACESPAFSKQPLGYKMSESKRDINIKLGEVEHKLREAWTDTLKLKLQFTKIENNNEASDEVYKSYLSMGF
ncbi:BA75_03643T0 [Komagataella pastoris]|uniref:BA75_03643T0 n=1 Tax=Komagataella pastoris TaxID=4922 RepID=A0A1B2JE42_PICPA|nr:BA75_03643T0 [Komagataella pastoris]